MNSPLTGQHRVYGGHLNQKTFLKNVSYFGPKVKLELPCENSGQDLSLI